MLSASTILLIFLPLFIAEVNLGCIAATSHSTQPRNWWITARVWSNANEVCYERDGTEQKTSLLEAQLKRFLSMQFSRPGCQTLRHERTQQATRCR